jgi:hypothetical protein
VGVFWIGIGVALGIDVEVDSRLRGAVQISHRVVPAGLRKVHLEQGISMSVPPDPSDCA